MVFYCPSVVLHGPSVVLHCLSVVLHSPSVVLYCPSVVVQRGQGDGADKTGIRRFANGQIGDIMESATTKRLDVNHNRSAATTLQRITRLTQPLYTRI